MSASQTRHVKAFVYKWGGGDCLFDGAAWLSGSLSFHVDLL